MKVLNINENNKAGHSAKLFDLIFFFHLKPFFTCAMFRLIKLHPFTVLL